MRKDLDKVVTERPRHGHSEPSLKTSIPRMRRVSQQFDEDGLEIDSFEDMPHRLPVSASRQHGYDAKEFSDLLGPLRACLMKQVGRPWDKVYSELSQSLDRRSLAGIHIWGHVKSEVELHPVIRDGVVYHGYQYHSFGTPLRLIQGLYVHPLSGILRYVKETRFRYKKKKEDPNLRKIDEFNQYERLNGIWFRCHYHNAPRYSSYYVNRVLERKQDGFNRVLQNKRQLSSRELRDLKFTNL